MTGSPDTPLQSVVDGLSGNPEFLAAWFAAAPDQGTRTLDGLGLDQGQRLRLLLCRAPRPSRFPADVEAVARTLTLDPTRLARSLREVAALTAIGVWSRAIAGAGDRRGPGSIWDGLLAAARDRRPEQLGADAADGWARARAERFWLAAPDDARERLDLDSAMAWTVSLAIVTLPALDQAQARAWLDDHGIQLGLEAAVPKRRLDGLLIAARGCGVVFLDSELPPVERRFTLAHELGHFLLDYAEQRQRVLDRAPDLLEVVDGIRPATRQERLQAVLARAPIGLHTHLLDRDRHGDGGHEVELVEDVASRFALELLSPWDRVLDLARELSLPAADGRQRPFNNLLSEVATTIADRFQLPAWVAEARSRDALHELGVRRSFFERDHRPYRGYRDRGDDDAGRES